MATTAADALRRIGIRLAALAQDGQTYADDDYDRDRYRQLGRLAAELLSVTDRPSCPSPPPAKVLVRRRAELERGPIAVLVV